MFERGCIFHFIYQHSKTYIVKSSILLFLPSLVLISCNNDSSNSQPSTDSSAGQTTKIISYRDSVDLGLIKESLDTIKGSPYQSVMATIGKTKIEIGYSSPGVKGRIIWGGLVPYDKVWVTGAHQATSIEFSNKVKIGEKDIPAGKYAFFTIPGRDKWIAIINKRYDQHLADEYNEKEDIVRLELTPENHPMTQRLTYAIDKIDEQTAAIVVQWEKIALRVPVKLIFL
jgi:hypothetical protein